MYQADAKLQWDIDNQLYSNLDTNWVKAFWIYPSCKCVYGLYFLFLEFIFQCSCYYLLYNDGQLLGLSRS